MRILTLTIIISQTIPTFKRNTLSWTEKEINRRFKKKYKTTPYKIASSFTEQIKKIKSRLKTH